MISRHHSERVHPANSGRVSTSSIRVASASETLSPIGTRAESASLGRAMGSRYPERAGWNASASRGLLPRAGRRTGLPLFSSKDDRSRQEGRHRVARVEAYVKAFCRASYGTGMRGLSALPGLTGYQAPSGHVRRWRRSKSCWCVSPRCNVDTQSLRKLKTVKHMATQFNTRLATRAASEIGWARRRIRHHDFFRVIRNQA